MKKFICYCIEIDENTIKNAILEGHNTLKMIKKETTACTGNECKEKNPSGKCCSKDIKRLIETYSNNIDNSNCNCCK